MQKQIIRYPSTSSTKILMVIDAKDRTSSRIARALGTTYSHTNKLLRDLRNEGLVELIDIGNSLRDKPMALTEKGMKIKAVLIKLDEVYNE